MKVTHIVGARPQFIKYFPISSAIKKFNGHFPENCIKDILIHTGQHYDYAMSKIFFNKFGIKEPDYHLGVGSGLHGEQTGKIIQKVEEVLINEKPDIVMVYGDTNSTLGGALAAAKHHIPIAHIEAGLRSFNKYMPEEINRILTDHVSTFLFCPSKTAVKNLMNEGFKNLLYGGEILPVDYCLQGTDVGSTKKDSNNPFVLNIGDVMYDILIYAIEIAEKHPIILEQLQLTPKNYYLLTLHRAENTDNMERLEEIIGFVNDISGDKTIIFPIHPRTRKVYGNAKKRFVENVKIVEPVDYFDILMLLKTSALILTDSGGLQKEAYWLKIPCITLRDETEWMETVQGGWNILYKDYNGSHNLKDVNGTYYGDGKAAERIVYLINEGLHNLLR